MPCCTLIAFLLSQCGIAAGAVKTRLFGPGDPAVPASSFTGLRARWLALAAMLVLEGGLGAAAAPYVATGQGRAQAAASFTATWHVCSVFLRGRSD
ncbi:MAG: hypothetical protein WDM91_06745 [Rhizomicrobium sp.]